MSVKKPTTTDDPVLAGPPAEGPTPTLPVGDPVPETLNLTDSKPDDPDESASLTSPWGSKVTVPKDRADLFK